jgi:exonuclease III
MEFKTFNTRISLLTIIIKSYWVNFTIINVHAPNKEKTQKEKDDFYNELTNVVDGIPNNRIVVILGDLNVKVGKLKVACIK